MTAETSSLTQTSVQTAIALPRNSRNHGTLNGRNLENLKVSKDDKQAKELEKKAKAWLIALIVVSVAMLALYFVAASFLTFMATVPILLVASATIGIFQGITFKYLCEERSLIKKSTKHLEADLVKISRKLKEDDKILLNAMKKELKLAEMIQRQEAKLLVIRKRIEELEKT